MQNIRFTNVPHALVPNRAAPTASCSIAGTAVTLAGAGITLHAATQTVFITVDTAEVRVCPDGTTPTSSLGHALAPSNGIYLSASSASVAKWIRTGSTATLQVSQYLN